MEELVERGLSLPLLGDYIPLELPKAERLKNIDELNTIIQILYQFSEEADTERVVLLAERLVLAYCLEDYQWIESFNHLTTDLLSSCYTEATPIKTWRELGGCKI